MTTDTEQIELDEPDRETAMDGGLCRLDPTGLASHEDEDDDALRRERDED